MCRVKSENINKKQFAPGPAHVFNVDIWVFANRGDGVVAHPQKMAWQPILRRLLSSLF